MTSTTTSTSSSADSSSSSSQSPPSKKLTGKEKATRLDSGLLSMLDQKHILANQLPIIYREENNISFFGLQKYHPFDPEKYRRISEFLISEKAVPHKKAFISQKQVSDKLLKDFHSEKYLKELQTPAKVAQVTEFAPLAYMPYFLLKWRLITPMLYQVGGTILGGELALKYGWSICLSGGMHHAHADGGGGWCMFSDVPMAIKHLMEQKKITKAMIIDTDAHQGNGHERDHLQLKMGPYESVYILDCYNRAVYPRDREAAKGINCKVTFECHVQDKEYLDKLEEGLKLSFSEFKPDIIFYNAGTDCMVADPLGHMSITPKGIVTRDEMVWRYAITNKIPIVQVLSGGYQKSNARVIADSIKHLMKTFNLEQLAQTNFVNNLL